ncbi:MAG: CBS domain-containing protein [Bdellovibrionales bacterium]|nr:CBS domain-containing protein [Bdellovibrionales bacterium]
MFLQRFGLRRLKIKDCMTKEPTTLRPTTHVLTARRIMGEEKIRHLPVVDGKKLIGIISERDLDHYAAVYKNKDIDREVMVEELCIFQPYAVDENTELVKVLPAMRENKYGSILVTKKGELSGILTYIDVCRILERVL